MINSQKICIKMLSDSTHLVQMSWIFVNLEISCFLSTLDVLDSKSSEKFPEKEIFRNAIKSFFWSFCLCPELFIGAIKLA